MSAVAVAMSLYANAPEPGPLSGTSFEGLAAGDYDITQAGGATDEGGELVAISGGATYWDTNSTAELKIINEESSVASRPEVFESCYQTNYLSIKTTLGNPVTRYIDADHTQSVAIGDGLYFDSLVNFTAFDDDPQVVTNGEKLAIWLKEVYGNGDSADPTGTNLMITAGYINGDNGVIVTNYTCSVPDVNLNVGGWHRVTVKMLGTIFNGQTTPGFVVYVDTKPVVCSDPKFVLPDGVSLTDNAAAFEAQHSLFPSALQSGDNKSLVKAVDFDGQGFVDDIVFTTKAPTFAKDTEFFTIIVDENIATASYSLNGGDSVSMAPGSTNALVYTSGSTYFTLSGIAAATGYMTNGVELVGITEDAQQAGKYDVNAVNATATIKAKPLGAYVGDTPYETLADAIAAANGASSDCTVKLAANANAGITIENASAVITIDLAGNTITNASGSAATIIAKGGSTVFVTNSTETVGKVQAAENAGVLGYAVNKNGSGTSITLQAGVFDGQVKPNYITGGSFLATYGNNAVNTKAALDAILEGSGYEATLSDNYYTVQEKVPTVWADLLGDPVDGAYTIDDTADLLALQRGVLLGFATSNVTFKQTANIDMTGVEGFWGIGWFTSSDAKDASITASGNIKFEGVYDGNNKTLSNVTIVRHNYAGIFNCIENATIRDLTVSNVTFSGTCSEEGFAVVGNAYTGCTIANVTSAGTWPAGMRHNAAGIVVRPEGNTTIRGCVNNVNISTTSKRVGGIAAFVGSDNTGTVFDSCTNNAAIVSTDGTRGVGGILGCAEGGKKNAPTANDTIIRNCVDFGSETAQGSGGHAGAIVGSNWNESYTYTDDGGNTFAASTVDCGYIKNAIFGRAYAVDAGIDGFNYLTTVKAADLAAGNTYVLLTNAAPTFALAAAGDTIAFDTARGYTLDGSGITFASGTVTASTSGTVTTYTAAAAPSGLDPEDGTTNVTVTAASESDAIAAAKSAIIVPTGSGATAAEYAELFTYSATGEGGTYNVAITGIQDSVVTGVSEEAVAVFSGDTAVAIPAGLYYRITPGTALPVSGVAQTGLSTGSVTVTKPGTTQGFLKVELSAIPFPQN